MADRVYKKDLSHKTWDQVYARQVARTAQAEEWLGILKIKPGDRVLDAGCGPGHISLMTARLVGPTGAVYALDRSAEAINYLQRLMSDAGITWIRPLQGDVATLGALPGPVDAVLLTMMLHHNDDARLLLVNMARLMEPSTPAMIAEYHPEGACEVGPPSEHRLHPDQLRSWCDELGFAVEEYRRQTPEHYLLVIRKQ